MTFGRCLLLVLASLNMFAAASNQADTARLARDLLEIRKAKPLQLAKPKYKRIQNEVSSWIDRGAQAGADADRMNTELKAANLLVNDSEKDPDTFLDANDVGFL